MFETILYFFEDCIESFANAFQYNSSELNWCEFQYTKSIYIAEFWNTVTSFVLSLVGLYGLYTSSTVATKFYLLLIFIGLASVYFHATLSFAGQLLDELGITLIMLIANYTMYVGDSIGLWLISIFGILQLIIQFTYSEYNRFILFLYAILFINKFWLALKSNDKMIKWYAHITVGLFVSSVVCWICDFYICEKDSFLNFHGIWHILIALTSYFTVETCLLVTKKNANLPHHAKHINWTDYYEQ